MGYTETDWLAINTTRLLAVRSLSFLSYLDPAIGAFKLVELPTTPSNAAENADLSLI
jgi:hypothetical protein